MYWEALRLVAFGCRCRHLATHGRWCQLCLMGEQDARLLALRDAGLVTPTRCGRSYKLTDQGMALMDSVERLEGPDAGT